MKRVSLTDLERRPEHLQSTANLFGLPAFCHYGVGTIGSPGSGAWRELAVHTMTTNWVLTAEHEGFPLMYHWRVLPGSTPLSKELADVERAVAYWDDAPQVRRRIHALQQSSTSVALFLEYIPEDLHQWLGVQVEAGDGTTDQAATMVERELEVGTSFMQSRGLLHFDAHFENILTDGRRLYFADFGLALSSDFDLSPEEADFCDRHQSYDRSYTATYLVNWLVTALHGYARQDQEGRCTMVRAYAEGRLPCRDPRRDRGDPCPQRTHRRSDVRLQPPVSAPKQADPLPAEADSAAQRSTTLLFVDQEQCPGLVDRLQEPTGEAYLPE